MDAADKQSNSLQTNMPSIQFTYQILLIYDLPTASRASTEYGENAEGGNGLDKKDTIIIC